MDYNEGQKTAITAPGSVAITAAAGTGKTAILAARYLFHITHHRHKPLQIVALTFTDKAALELRKRIREDVGKAGDLDDYEEVISQLEAAQISTIHSLAARICREHPEAAAVPPDFEIMDEFKEKLWLDEHLGNLVTNLPQEIFKILPYSKIRTILQLLLKDPYTTEKALAIGPERWADLIEDTLDQLLEELYAGADWQEAVMIVEQTRGPATGTMFNLQGEVCSALKALRQKSTRKEAIKTRCSFRMPGKMPSGWIDEDYLNLKQSLELIRNKLIRLIVYKKDEPNPFVDGLTDIDKQLENCLVYVKQLFEIGIDYLNAEKRDDRLLSFSDLEIHALNALRNDEVQRYYQQRWKAILVDEFQDTNPIQREILERISAGCILSIVGDEKQSIYSFRRADVSVFAKVREEILEQQGLIVSLSTSYRMHKELANQLNIVFSTTLEDLHQDLVSERVYSQDAPHIKAFYIKEEEVKGSKDSRRIAEANRVAGIINDLLAAEVPVYDKSIGAERPIQAGDIAILSHVGAVLNTHYEALASHGIDGAFAGGGDLLSVREARDARSLLAFLADPNNSLALTAVVRSPFFAVSDITLVKLLQNSAEKIINWQALRSSTIDELAFARHVLGELIGSRKVEPPSRLLQMADRMTGYSAVIANLPNADRRLADWRGYLSFIQELEHGVGDIFTVVRKLERIEKSKSTIERPVLTGGNSVTLSTIHKAKGLEWSVVFVVDLAREDNRQQDYVLMDADLGLAVKIADATGKMRKPALYQILSMREEAKQDAEARRVLYVALTRAKDQIYLTATDLDKGKMKRIAPGLDNAGVAFQPVIFSSEDAMFSASPAPVRNTPSGNELTGSIASRIAEISATALSTYSSCPKRFRFEVVEKNPGISEGEGLAIRIGSAVHHALENGVDELQALGRIDPTLAQEELETVKDLVDAFNQSDIYKPFRDNAVERELPLSFPVEGIRIKGIADVVGPDWVLDYKTDTNMEPEHHQLQLWVYARALAREEAYIAYLRHNVLHKFSRTDLEKLEPAVSGIVNRIKNGDFQPSPNQDKCSYCLYKDICEEGGALLGLSDEDTV